MTLEDTIRQVVHEEVRTAVREEIRAALAEITKPAAPETMLTVEEVAVRAGNVKPATVRDWIKSGRLEHKRAGHRYLVSAEALAAFLAQGAATKSENVTLGADEHLKIVLERIEATPKRGKK